MTSRRRFIQIGALGAIAPACVFAQSRPARIGILSGLPRDKSIFTPLLLQALSELGYREGSGMQLVFRSGDGTENLYPKLARELIDSKCDVIFALLNDLIARAFRDARTPIPVVFLANEYDPLEKGIVDNLRRPGGNITGVYSPSTALVAKGLEIMQEILPGAKRFLVLADIHSKDHLAALTRAAATLGVQLTVVEYKEQPHDLVGAFETGRRQKVDAFVGLASPVFAGRRTELSALLAKNRLPAIVPIYMASESGSLVSYAVDLSKLTRRGAELGVKILKGAKPADIPVEQMDEYELVVNLKTAKTLGLKIPYSVLARATKVIE